MSGSCTILAARIRSELKELSLLIDRARQGWERARVRDDSYYLDGVALNLHGFYSGLERIFEKIAASIDGNVPDAANWHRELLDQMSLEIPEIRPAVISDELHDLLEDYRGFRHVVRNVYTYHLNPEKIGRLIENIDPVIEKLSDELSAFASFLEES